MPPANWDSWKPPQEINSCNQGTTLKVMRYEKDFENKDARRKGILLLHVSCIRSTNCIRESVFIVISDSRVSTLFSEQKIQGLFKGFHGTHFPIFQGLHSVQKRTLSLRLLKFFHNMSNLILKVFLCLLLLGTWESGLHKVSTEIQGLSSTNCNFYGISRPFGSLF